MTLQVRVKDKVRVRSCRLTGQVVFSMRKKLTLHYPITAWNQGTNKGMLEMRYGMIDHNDVTGTNKAQNEFVLHTVASPQHNAFVMAQ